MTKSPDRFSWKMRLLLLLILTAWTFEFTLSCPRHTVVPAFFQIVTKMCVFCLQERQRHWCAVILLNAYKQLLDFRTALHHAGLCSSPDQLLWTTRAKV